MIRRENEQTIDHKCIRGGKGEAELHLLLKGEEEMFGRIRMFNRMVLAPGNTIGEHTHSGDNEIFYFLSGSGTYNDNGNVVSVGPGDTTLCKDGEMHSLANTGTEPLEFIAVIVLS